MKKISNLENGAFFLFVIIALIVIYAIIAISFLSGTLAYNNIGPLTFPSLILFLIACLLATWKEKYYFLLLIFIVVAFPSPIDDIFPSVLISNSGESNLVVFPLITRIDVFLILGISLKLIRNGFKLPILRLTIPLKLFFIISFFVFIANLIKAKDVLDINLFLAYTFQIRYLILFLVFFQLYDVRKYQKEIIYGFIICLCFLFLEASINTNLKNLDRLSSGSLSLNTFANISAAIGLYLIFLLKKHKIGKTLGLFGLGMVFLILTGSGTRGAFLTLILAYFLLYLLENPRKRIINFFKVVFGITVVLGLYFFLTNNELLPKRFSSKEIEKNITIDFSRKNLNDILEISITKETSSIKSRIDLFDSSINMIKENYLTGIGAGRWNRYKNNYSSDKSLPNVLLDSHNDYLAILSQYGLILGLLISYLIFFYPLLLFSKIKMPNKGALAYIFVINFGMGIAAISNAGFFKHQVCALLFLDLAILLKIREYDN